MAGSWRFCMFGCVGHPTSPGVFCLGLLSCYPNVSSAEFNVSVQKDQGVAAGGPIYMSGVRHLAVISAQLLLRTRSATKSVCQKALRVS